LTIGYDIYLLQLGFHPVAVVPTLVQKRHKEKQYRSNNTQNKKQDKNKKQKSKG